MTSAPAPAADQPRPRPRHALAGAAVGVLAAAVAVGGGQLAAGLTVPQGSPLVAVGQAAIDATPAPVKDFAISSFGADDKTVLLGGILVVLALYAAVVGILAVRRLTLGLCGLAIFACLGLAAALTRPNATAEYAVPTLAGAAAGAFALYWLARAAAGLDAPATRARPGRRAAPVPHAALAAPDLPASAEDGSAEPAGIGQAAGSAQMSRPTEQAGAAHDEEPPAYSFTYLPNPDDQEPSGWPARRRFLMASGIAVAAAAAGALAGRELITRGNVSRARAGVRFPRPAVPAPPLPPGTNLNIPGLSSFITPDASFYRVDTALLVPQVDPATWQLRIHGMVQREVSITFDELLKRPLIEHYVTLTCVSNPVGGPYAGNAKWLGASLAALIRQARPLAGADQLLCTSVDGFTSGTPLQVVLDGRDALLAIAMNGTALPVEHGFPARMVVPGLYGYVSATKWVTDIEVTTFAAASAYWAQRGWAQQGPIKTESRIDVPAGGASLAPGRTPVAGVAWAQHKGIAAVEVRVDGGPWHQARLAAVPGIDTWRQWVWEWQATPGQHLIEARATDATGYIQTAVQAPPPPDGASGYPSATVTVSGSLRAACHSRAARIPLSCRGRGWSLWHTGPDSGRLRSAGCWFTPPGSAMSPMAAGRAPGDGRPATAAPRHPGRAAALDRRTPPGPRRTPSASGWPPSRDARRTPARPVRRIRDTRTPGRLRRRPPGPAPRPVDRSAAAPTRTRRRPSPRWCWRGHWLSASPSAPPSAIGLWSWVAAAGR